MAGVALCSTTVCYEATAPSTAQISSTAAGTSTAIVDLEVPHSSISSIRFKFVAGPAVLHGSITLPQALNLEPDFKGGDVLVVVQRRPNGGARATYEPVAAAANYLQPEGSSIYYNPKFATSAELPLGSSITIPAGAYPAPQVFVAGVHDTGDEFPLVDLSPAVKLTRPASVQLSTIVRAPKALDSNQVRPTPALKAASPGGAAPLQLQSQADVSIVPTTSSFETFQTGVMRPPSQAKSPSTGAALSSSAVTTAATCNSAGWCKCADALAYPPNQLIIFNGLAPTGNEYLDWCTTIPPYVHITVSNLADSRERFTIRHDNKVTPPKYFSPYLPLRRITTWSQYTQAMVNGFTWEGWDGTGAGQYGKANGHVHDFAFALGDNLSGGGSCVDLNSSIPCNNFLSGGNKRVMQIPATGAGFNWMDNSNAGVLSNSLSYVSSSTSIVKNGVCSTDTLSSRWSAVGTTSGGRIIFMSSTSDGTTTAAELCPVFQAMGVFNAIRLDGGPSAALTVDGALKNPLTGLYFLKYGSARYIPYALKVSYPGW